jgi:predicted Zn-dependent protease
LLNKRNYYENQEEHGFKMREGSLFNQSISYVLISVFSLGLFGCTEFNSVTQRQEMILYSTDREINIGKNIVKQIEKEYEPEENPLVVERVNKIMDRIAAASDRKDVSYSVRVIKAKDEEKEDGADINAFALPGGYVYVFDGLVNFADDDDQLASVIAHEVGHVVAKHGIKKLQLIMGYVLLNVLTVATGDPEFAGGVNYAFVNMLLAYSREDELLADKLGVRYAKEAGYKPRAMIDFLEKLREKKKKEPLRAKSIYRTHPYFSERITTIKRELGEPLTVRDYVSVAND